MLFEACDRCFVMFCTFAALFFWDDKTETFWNAKRGKRNSIFFHHLFPFPHLSPPPTFPTCTSNFSLQLVTVSSVPPSLSLLISTLLSPSSFRSFSPSFYPMLTLLLLHQILKQISHEISSFLHPLLSCRSLLLSMLDAFAHSPLHGLRVLSVLNSPILNVCSPAGCRNVNIASDGIVRLMKKEIMLCSVF